MNKIAVRVLPAVILTLVMVFGAVGVAQAGKPIPPPPSIDFGTLTYDGANKVTVTNISWENYNPQAVSVALVHSPYSFASTIWKPKGKAGKTWEPISSISVSANGWSSGWMVQVWITLEGRKGTYSEIIKSDLVWGTPYP